MVHSFRLAKFQKYTVCISENPITNKFKKVSVKSILNVAMTYDEECGIPILNFISDNAKILQQTKKALAFFFNSLIVELLEDFTNCLLLEKENNVA